MLNVARPLSLALLLVLFCQTDADAAKNSRIVTIQVKDMHCANCAKKIARKLYAVPAVVGVKVKVSANTAWVSPERTKNPSPRALWEAVEAAGHKPVKLAGPYGTFTDKPSR